MAWVAYISMSDKMYYFGAYIVGMFRKKEDAQKKLIRYLLHEKHICNIVKSVNEYIRDESVHIFEELNNFEERFEKIKDKTDKDFLDEFLDDIIKNDLIDRLINDYNDGDYDDRWDYSIEKHKIQ